MTFSVHPVARVLVPVLTLSALLVSATVAAAGSHAVVPDPTLEPAVAEGRESALAFTARDGHGALRVHASIPAGGDPLELGPALHGEDGAPALVGVPGDGFLVLASRSGRAGSLLWSQWFDGRRWSTARVLPGIDRASHHPALARGGDHVWAAWISGDGNRDPESIVAAPWSAGIWGPPEPIPAAPGTPGRPAIAVDPNGNPVVVWAAPDEDADPEIWLSHRRARGWTKPARLTHDDVPDITPQVAFAGHELLTAWSSFTPDGYEIRAGTARGRHHLRAHTVSSTPGSAPRMVSGDDAAHVVWSSPSPRDPQVSELRVATWRDGRFDRDVGVLEARNARTAVASGRTGEWLAAWHDGDGLSAAALTPSWRGAPRIRPLRGDARRTTLSDLEIQFPGSYLAFGDSITAGVVRYNGVVSFVEGYPVHLGRMISDLFGQNIVVAQRAVPGEMTPEGLNRLRSIMISEPRKIVLVNEGVNDLGNLQIPYTVFQTLMAMTAVVRDRDALPVLSTITPRAEGGFGGGINRRIEETNAYIRRAKGAALLVDLHAAFNSNPKYYSDHIHPNADGYVYMATVWFRGLLPVLNYLVETRDVERDLDAAAAKALASRRLDHLR